MIQIIGVTRENGKVTQVGVNGFIADDVDENETIYFDRVVRCGSCQNYHDGYCILHSEEPDQYSSGHTVWMEPWDYCSYGELKEKTENGRSY